MFLLKPIGTADEVSELRAPVHQLVYILNSRIPIWHNPTKRNQSSKIGPSRRPLCSSLTPSPPTRQTFVKVRKGRQVKTLGCPTFHGARPFMTFPVTNKWCHEIVKHIGMVCVVRCPLYLFSNHPVCVGTERNTETWSVWKTVLWSKDPPIKLICF